MDIKEYKDNLLKFDLKSFLNKYTQNDIFKFKKLYPENYLILSEQIKLYPKALEKLPVFSSNYCYFTTKSYEQSSSEALAEYKAGRFKGNKIIDLTGGLGVDDWAFADKFKTVISIDKDTGLNNLARINFTKLKISNIERIDADSNDYINRDIKADLVYIDADRRTKNKKSVTFTDSEPDILKILPRLRQITPDILLKLSPLIDISYIRSKLTNIKTISVISYENEVKEILVHIQNDFNDRIEIKAVNISKSLQRSEFSGYPENYAKVTNTIGGKFFYEPSGCIIKAGIINSYASASGLNTISTNGVYLLGNVLIKNFMGRSFEVIKMIEYSKNNIKEYLLHNKIVKANISARNFAAKPEQLKKLFKLTDGGEHYFFFTQGFNRKKYVYHCLKNKWTQREGCAQGYYEK